MTVKELIEKLLTLDPNRVVVLSRDEEGNGFNELAHITNCSYRKGEIGLEQLTAELRRQGYTEEDLMEGTPALVLWP